MLPPGLPGGRHRRPVASSTPGTSSSPALVLMTGQSQFTLPIMMTAVQSGRFGGSTGGAVQAGVTVDDDPLPDPLPLLQR